MKNLFRFTIAIIAGAASLSCDLPKTDDSNDSSKCVPANISVIFHDKSGSPYINLDLSMRRGPESVSYTPSRVKSDAQGKILLKQVGCEEFAFRQGSDGSGNLTNSGYAYLSDVIYGYRYAGFKRAVDKFDYEVILPKIIYSDSSSVTNPGLGEGSWFWQGNETSNAMSSFRSGSHYVVQALKVPSNTSACGLGFGLFAINQYPVDRIQIYDDNGGVPGNLLYNQVPDVSLGEGAYTSYNSHGSYVDFCKNNGAKFQFLAGHTYWIGAYYQTTPPGISASIKPGLPNSGLIPLESADGVHWQRAFMGYSNSGHLVPSLTISLASLNAYNAGTLVPDDFAIEVFLVE